LIKPKMSVVLFMLCEVSQVAASLANQAVTVGQPNLKRDFAGRSAAVSAPHRETSLLLPESREQLVDRFAHATASTTAGRRIVVLMAAGLARKARAG
jgi:hypothetical protein